MASFQDRIIRAAKLDIDLYEEVEADTEAMGQAMAVVVLSSLASGIAFIGETGISGLIVGALMALGGWFVWAYITYFVGTRILPEPQTEADHGELLRTIGFSSAPGLLRILGIIPGLLMVVHFVAGIWMLVAMVVAIRQALDYKSTLRAVGVCFIGFLIYVIVSSLIVSLFGLG